jgi:hypothetical protein
MKNEINCSTQAELDAALKNGDIPLLQGNRYFEVRGSAQVRAYGSAQVRAYDSAQVTAYGSAQVTAYGFAQVTAYGFAQVRAYDSAQVRAYNFAQVTACGSAQVTACGSAQVTACGSAQVRAYDSAQVRAEKFVAVTAHGKACKIVGGKVIKIFKPRTVNQWCAFYGVNTIKGVAVMFKAVDKDFKSNRNGFEYKPGTTPKADDWDGGDKECGGGLHFSPRAFMALELNDSAVKFIACPVRIRDCRAPKEGDQYPQKIKASGCCGPIWEVDQDGNKI